MVKDRWRKRRSRWHYLGSEATYRPENSGLGHRYFYAEEFQCLLEFTPVERAVSTGVKLIENFVKLVDGLPLLDEQILDLHLRFEYLLTFPS